MFGVVLRKLATSVWGAVFAAIVASAAPAFAQVIGPDVSPPTQTGGTNEMHGLIAGAIVPINEETSLIVGGLYGDSTTSSDLAGGFAILNRTLTPNWTFTLGYLLIEPQVSGRSNPRNQSLRIGGIYRKTWGRLSFDNRTLYEHIFADQGRVDGNRVRNRSRLTYQLNPSAKLRPKVFGYIEPIYDDRFDTVQIVNYTAGAGIRVNKVDIDLFMTRLERKPGTGADIDGLTLQMMYRF